MSGAATIMTIDELHTFCKSVSLPSRFGFTEAMAFTSGKEIGVIIDLRVPDRYIPGAFTEISNSFRFALPVERGYVAEMIRVKTLDLLCHEASEWICIDGVVTFDPHGEHPPRSYEEMCKALDARDAEVARLQTAARKVVVWCGHADDCSHSNMDDETAEPISCECGFDDLNAALAAYDARGK